MIKYDPAKNNNNDVDNEETSRKCNESQSILKDSVVLFLRNFQNQIFFTLA